MLPLLPAEVWLIVFRFATGDHGVHDTSYISPLDTSSPDLTMRHFILAYRRGLTTKRALMLVCKIWHRWSLPFLYETVVLDTGRRRGINSFVEAFNLALNPTGATLRLHVHISLQPIEEGLLSSIIERLPHVKILTIVGDGDLQRLSSANDEIVNLFRVLLSPSAFRPSLQSLVLGDIRIPKDLDIGRLPMIMPNLCTLRLRIDFRSEKYQGLPNLSSLPNLHTLSIHNSTIEYLRQGGLVWTVPRLKQLEGAGSITTWPSDVLGDTRDISSLTITQPERFNTSLALISACPNLTDIILPTSVIFYRDPVPFRRIGLTTLNPHTLTLPSEISDLISSVRDHFISLSNPVTYPRLSVIRLIDHSGLWWEARMDDISRKAYAFWYWWQERWRARGVRLELMHGEPLVLPEMEEGWSAEKAEEAYIRYWQGGFGVDKIDNWEEGEDSDEESGTSEEDSWRGQHRSRTPEGSEEDD